jgi:3-phenylpropionate/cinnamic acid dioxygenase small subunit
MRDLTTAERIEIAETLGRYGRLIDAQDWAALDQVFTADARFEIVPLARAPLAGLAEIRRHMAHAARHPAAHHITNVHVTHTTDDGAHVESMLIAVQVDHSVASGLYRDEFVRTPAGLRIRRRVFEWVLAPRVSRPAPGA